jgi:hypothetical protein
VGALFLKSRRRGLRLRQRLNGRWWARTVYVALESYLVRSRGCLTKHGSKMWLQVLLPIVHVIKVDNSGRALEMFCRYFAKHIDWSQHIVMPLILIHIPEQNGVNVCVGVARYHEVDEHLPVPLMKDEKSKKPEHELVFVFSITVVHLKNQGGGTV